MYILQILVLDICASDETLRCLEACSCPPSVDLLAAQLSKEFEEAGTHKVQKFTPALVLCAS